MTFYKILNISPSNLIQHIDKIPRMSDSENLSTKSCDPKEFLWSHVYEKMKNFGELSSLIFEQKYLAEKNDIHIDIQPKRKMPVSHSLNITVFGQGTMRWYKPIGNGILKKNPKANTSYVVWETNFGKILDEWNTDKVALVRTDIPHQAFNYNKETRLTVSLRWTNFVSWSDTIEFFENNF